MFLLFFFLYWNRTGCIYSGIMVGLRWVWSKNRPNSRKKSNMSSSDPSFICVYSNCGGVGCQCSRKIKLSRRGLFPNQNCPMERVCCNFGTMWQICAFLCVLCVSVFSYNILSNIYSNHWTICPIYHNLWTICPIHQYNWNFFLIYHNHWKISQYHNITISQYHNNS